jgi:hypothetical protein
VKIGAIDTGVVDRLSFKAVSLPKPGNYIMGQVIGVA